MINSPNFWDSSQNILIILAHPDDPEFFCGGSIALWNQQGHEVSYCLLTKGDKGINDQFKMDDSNKIKELRVKEERKAAAVLGVKKIIFYDNPDGYLVPNLLLRRQVVKVIRQVKPDIVVSCDPTNYYMRDTTINHPDHRAAGQVVVDSVYPAAQNKAFFPDLLVDKGLIPHKVKEVWLSLPTIANLTIDITNTWETKIRALHEHRSQIGNIEAFDLRMRSRRTEDSTDEYPKFEETFRRINFQK
jgi:LmbE family N-acetylglucosaminyl deacetylase